MEQLGAALTEVGIISVQLGIPLVMLFLIGYIISARDQSAHTRSTGRKN